MHPPPYPPRRDAAPMDRYMPAHPHAMPPPPAPVVALPPISVPSKPGPPPLRTYDAPPHLHPLDLPDQAPVEHYVYQGNEPPRLQHVVPQSTPMPFAFPPPPSRRFPPPAPEHGAPPRREAKKIRQRRDEPARELPADSPVRYKAPGKVDDMARAHDYTAKPAPKAKVSRMQIADLITSNADEDCMRPAAVQQPAPPARRDESRGHVYQLSVRQQPIAARACGFGERDRRVVDPPPIIEFTVKNPSATEQELMAVIRDPNIVIHCKLLGEDGQHDMTSMPEASDRRQQRRLMGTLVASPFVGRDEKDQEGCFFCFPDLSCRTPGSYRLEFSVVILDPLRMGHGYSSPVRSTVQTDVFQVYSAKEFPGMRASTELTKRLKEQGCLISVKKGSERAGPGHVHARGEESEEEDDGDDRSRKRR